MGRIALLVFSVGFKMDGPFRRIERRDFQWIGVRAGVDNPSDVLTIPIHLNGQVIPLSGARSPVAVPNARQWMALLGKPNSGYQQASQKAKNKGGG